MPDPELDRVAKQARRAAQLALLCVIVALIVLAIDNSIKRHIVAKASEARAILEEFNVAAGQVMHGRQAEEPNPAGGTADPGSESGISVGGAAGGSEVVVAPAVGDGGASGSGRAGGAGGPRGNG